MLLHTTKTPCAFIINKTMLTCLVLRAVQLKRPIITVTVLSGEGVCWEGGLAHAHADLSLTPGISGQNMMAF